ncbi:hypothetical protein LO80_05895 [Candidatus Francisella endociliophora]|uniref:Uncharacterized protein n=1 Tax=Candidatus Francisella endociliophora TaxID=653937 RepID=A0A097EPP7_9GAMM|nr:DUF1415 domain-containing protein [Francisella sp. FSC1006]AIT09540.1 hypothetical protein LO80_05895 [Francisella sp. FSC1006]
MDKNQVITATQNWVRTFVVGMNLCPFAKREVVKNRVRYFVSEATTTEQLLLEVQAELELLESDANIETTLVIHPSVLQDFYDYNDFLYDTDNLLIDMSLEGTYQIASFHPDYQFEGVSSDDVENYTNRSPYQMLHLIHEESLERAVANYHNPDDIPQRNIDLMNKLGIEKVKALLKFCFDS